MNWALTVHIYRVVGTVTTPATPLHKRTDVTRGHPTTVKGKPKTTYDAGRNTPRKGRVGVRDWETLKKNPCEGLFSESACKT